MSTENLDRLFAAATKFDASDLHLVAGVPPAYRVNGEIILADEDALPEKEVAAIAAAHPRIKHRIRPTDIRRIPCPEGRK